MPVTRVQLEGIAALLYDLVIELTRKRRGFGPHWLMVWDLQDAVARHGMVLTDEDFQAGIAIAVKRCMLKAAGTPVHSISAWQKGGLIDRAE